MTELAAGWEALSRGAWEEALELVGGSDNPEALEVAGVAHWWLDDADGAAGARERAYRAYRRRGDDVGAARVAGALAWDAMLFGGRAAVARGWLDRACRLLEEHEPSAEHAWLAVREAEVALAIGTPAPAIEAARRAIAVATEVGRTDIEIVGRSLEGLALVHQGVVEDGMRRLDESAVAATAGEVDDLMWIGKVCCNLISACERVGDVDRATQWCAEVREFAQRWELRTLFNVCRTQYAAVLLQTGAWAEAEEQLEAALAVFAGGRRSVLDEGAARLGELRRRQGRLEEARALFERSEHSSVARLGLVELALDEGDASVALALAERLRRATRHAGDLDRGPVLALAVRAAVAVGRTDAAAAALAELEQVVASVGTTGIEAAAAHAAGLVAEAAGDLELAAERLEDAVDLFGAAETPYERARARSGLARVLLAIGDAGRGRAEARAARDAFVALDARRDVALARRLLESAERPRAADGPLTPREREVLALVAAGRTNREAAAQLVVSEHTVHRHVANILRKLGEPTRAAAAARAARDGLL